MSAHGLTLWLADGCVCSRQVSLLLQRRAVEFKNYDDNAEDTWGGLVTILAEKKKEVEQEIRPAEPSGDAARWC